MTIPAPLALTMGDPSGIGLDLIISAWSQRVLLKLPPFIYLGDIKALEERAQTLAINIAVKQCSPDQAIKYFQNAIPAIDISCSNPVVAGRPDPDNAAAIIKSVEMAVTLSKHGKTSALVTNPIAKSILYDAGFHHPGHTEFLAELAKEDERDTSCLPIMMLAGPDLRTVPVTIHIPLMQVMDYLTSALIIETVKITNNHLQSYFGIKTPRLAIAGINPHAGENGALGHEDIEIVAPAVKELEKCGIKAYGPLPADTMFHEEARKNYDVGICMYHDQALIPVKALNFYDTVNITLGLPFIRTSVDHGTAFSLVGKNIARHDSLVAAIKMAHKISQRHKTDGL